MKTLGRISEMVVGLSQLATTVEKLENDLEPYLQVLSPIARVWVFAGPGAELPSVLELSGRRVCALPLPEDVATHWAKLQWIQDYFALGRGGKLLLQYQAKAHETKLVQLLARAMGRPCVRTAFKFDGGNVRRVDDTLLVGKDCLIRNGILLPSGKLDFTRWNELEQRLRESWGVRRLVWVGSQQRMESKSSWWQEFDYTYQPLYHLDLYLMPLGKGRIALGEVDINHIIGNLQLHRDAVATLKKTLDNLEKDLSNKGFSVVRLPILIVLSDSMLQVYSHLNGLVEEDALGKVSCFLPSYLESPAIYRDDQNLLQVAVQKRLRAEAVEVEWIKAGFGMQAARMGALHCTTNIISRTHG